MVTLKKGLKEHVRHGSNVFPLVSYLCRGKKYNTNVGMHWHPEVEINRFESGSFILNYGMKEYRIDGPCIAILPGNVLHNLVIKRGSNQSSLVFNPAIIEFSSYDEVESQMLRFLSAGGTQMPPLLTKNMECFEKADTLLEFIIENADTTSSCMRLRIKAHLVELLAIMYENNIFLTDSPSSSRDFEHNQQKIKDLLTYINTHYAEKISMNDAADYLRVSKQYFCRFFKKSTGLSFVDFINDLRLRRACQEIVLTSKSISDIAMDQGFDNIGYFFKLFKIKYGQTPLSYRRSKTKTAFDDKT